MKVIIIGAGASGLMAAQELARNNAEVVLLEKTARIGGRIHTFVPPGFTNHVEAGAEFIHGNLPLTLQWMKKAKLSFSPVTGKMYRYENGRMSGRLGQGKTWEAFYLALEQLSEDCTLTEFLNHNFSAKKHERLRRQVLEMAQGLDLADPDRLSVLSIRSEWLSGEMQYRPVTGYGPLLEFIRNEATGNKCDLHLNQQVSKIHWKHNQVKVVTQDSEFTADAVLVTAALGTLFKGEIAFDPTIAETENLFRSIGFGQVIKIVLEFDRAFWNEAYPDLGFLFTGGGFTFWSQLSENRPVLTVWIGDAYVKKYQDRSDSQLVEMALLRLSDALATEAKEPLKASAVFRYDEKSSSGGGYSWLGIQSKKVIRQLGKGLAETVFFAGEAWHPGAEVGTVEAALQSGRYAARQILKLKKN